MRQGCGHGEPAPAGPDLAACQLLPVVKCDLWMPLEAPRLQVFLLYTSLCLVFRKGSKMLYHVLGTFFSWVIPSSSRPETFCPWLHGQHFGVRFIWVWFCFSYFFFSPKTSDEAKSDVSCTR